MKDKVKLCLKISWLSAAVVILLMGSGMCAANDEACYQAGGAMFLLMFWLSFPSGLVFSLAALAFVDHESIHYPSDFISAWLVMALGGLLQWFVIVPRLFEKRYFTQLNLSCSGIIHTPAPELIGPATSSSPAIQTNRAPEAVVAPSVLNATLLEPPASPSPNADKTQSRRKKIRPKPIRSIAPFDKQGRTPLQRVIDSL
jgi:hypothetical protein